MNAASAVLLAVIVGAAGAFGGYTYAQKTMPPPDNDASWSTDRVLSTVAEARGMQPGLERTNRLFDAVRHVRPNEERIVIERLPLQTQDGVSYLVRDRLLDRWAMSDPQAAMAYAQRLTDTADREHASRVVAKTWAQIDAPAALNGAAPALVYAAWVDMDPVNAVKREYTMPTVNDEHQHAAFSAWLAQDPAAASTWVRENWNAPEAAAYAPLIVATKSPIEAKQWVNDTPQGEVRSSAQGALAMMVADKTPGEAIKLVRGMNPGPARAMAAASVISTLRRTGQDDIADEFTDESPLNADERKIMAQRMTAIAKAR